MSIIKLNFIFFRKNRKLIIVFFFVSSNNIVDRCRAEKILLFESKLFTRITWIIRIQNWSDVFCVLTLFYCSLIITGIKLVKIESISWSWSPKSQIVCVISIKPRNRCIISHCNNFLAIFPTCSFSWAILIFSGLTVKTNFVSDILAFNFPRISSFKPIIRNLNLITIFYSLFENPIIISDSIPPCRNL